MKKMLKLLIVVFLLRFTLDAHAYVDVTTGVLTDADWVNVTPASNSFDFLSDQQTGSGSVSQDLIGGSFDFGSGVKDYGVFYIQFDDNGTVSALDDELAFRFRVNDADGVHKDTFQYYVFVGLDFDLNGSVDLFTGMYNPDNMGSKSISIYSSDPDKSNTSPSTTGFGDKLYETTPVKNTNWSIMPTDDNSLFSGDTDYFISFKLSLTAINAALAQINASWTMTTSSPLRMFIGTASQANSYNQDMGGIEGLDTKSDVPWATLGVFAPVVTPTGDPVIINLAPTAQSDNYIVDHNGFVKFKLNASDPEDDVLTFTPSPLVSSGLSSPTCGSISGPDEDDYYTYTDNGTCLGDNTISFIAHDATHDSNTATITFTPINEDPVAESKSYDLPSGGSIKFKLEASDPEDQELSFPSSLTLEDPSCGSISGPDEDDYYTYTDNGTCTDPNTIKFTVSDGTNTSNEATLTFNPIVIVADDQTLNLFSGDSIKITLSATDANGHVLTYELTDTSCGDLTGPDINGDYTYTANGSCSSDSFTFTASYTEDGITYTSNVATIQLNIESKLPNTGSRNDDAIFYFGLGIILFILTKKPQTTK